MSSMYPSLGGTSPSPRPCARCGMPLAPNVINCVRCGAYNAPSQTNGAPGPILAPSEGPWGWGNGERVPQSPFGSGQISGQQWGQPSIPPQQNMPASGPLTSQPLPYPNNYYGDPNQFQQLSFNNYRNAPVQTTYPTSPSGALDRMQPGNINGYSYTGYDEPPQEKRGPKVGLFIGIVLLLLILIGGGFTGYLYFIKNHNHNTATTTTKPKHVPGPLPSVAPLFSDSFNNNHTGWDLSSKAGKFSVNVGGGSLILEDDQNMLLWEVLPGKTFNDFRLDVDASLSKGDPSNGYGIYIRGSSNQASDIATYYRFELYGDGTYAIFKGSLDSNSNTQSNKVQGYIANDAILKQGQVNHFTIIAKGPTMTFNVNGQTLYTFSDNSYKGGSVAFFVSNLPQLPSGAQATFSHLVIFPVTQAG